MNIMFDLGLVKTLICRSYKIVYSYADESIRSTARIDEPLKQSAPRHFSNRTEAQHAVG